MNRNLDIILFGATGFTGQLIAQYLSVHAEKENVQWGIAGRDQSKLEKVKATLTGRMPEIILADVNNPDSMRLMTAQTSILMNAVGPFNWTGRKVVDACLQSGTHYLDITGEPSFVADMYNSFHSSAQGKGVCIVNCCGFDSIPADFAAWLTARKLPLNEPKSLRGFVRTNATFSGGTLTTAIHALYLESQKKSIKVKIKRHPNAPRVPLKVHFNKDINAWAIPMPVVDPHIVKRSAHRLPGDYGEACSYGQFFVRSSFGKVVKTILPIAVAMVLVRFEFFRNWLFKKYQPGTGPDAARRADSKFEVVCLGESTTATARTVISGGDPGYNETAKMFSQAAFCLLSHLRGNTLKGGVLTPVEAFGMPLVERLREEGIVVE